MRKRLVFEVEKGETYCDKCPDEIRCDMQLIDCCKYDLSTLKFIGEEDMSRSGTEVKQAEEAGYEQAKEETISIACKWLSSHLPIIVDYYNENIHEQSDRDDFIRAFREYMEDKKI